MGTCAGYVFPELIKGYILRYPKNNSFRTISAENQRLICSSLINTGCFYFLTSISHAWSIILLTDISIYDID